MSAPTEERAPVYSALDLHAAEAAGYERGWAAGYLPGYRDGAHGTDVAAAAEAAAFAEVARRTFRDSLPHVELVRRRAEACGHSEVYAASLAAAEAQAARLQAIPTVPAPRRAA